MAIEDHGQIQGRPVRLALTEDDLCNGPGGRAGAETIVSHPDIVGVIGPSFSDAAVTAAPIVTSTGRVLVSGTTDSPLLTSIGGERGEEWNEGYFTTTGGVAFQGDAAGEFAANALEADTAITIASPVTFLPRPPPQSSPPASRQQVGRSLLLWPSGKRRQTSLHSSNRRAKLNRESSS